MEKQTIEIFKTTNYELFKRLKGNRAVTKQRIAIITESIKKIGYISNPIIINEKYEVIDGQGRVEALKQLGMPIEFRIIDKIGIDECRAMNLKPTGWSVDDFVESYAEYGIEDYNRIKKLKDKYNFGYTLLYAISQGKTSSGGSSQEELRRGSLKMPADKAQIVDILCKYLADFKDVQKKIGGRRDLFFGIIAFIANLEGVDLERLKVSIHQQRNAIAPVAKAEITLREISAVYNKGYSKKKHRYFDYEWKVKDGENEQD